MNPGCRFVGNFDIIQKKKKIDEILLKMIPDLFCLQSNNVSHRNAFKFLGVLLYFYS